MRVEELKELLNAVNLNEGAALDGEITCGYSCDLLSWVLAHGKQGMAWCTVQTHVNVIAVSVLMEMACVIMVEGVQPEEASLKKAMEEGMPILSTSKTAYEVCGLMSKAGVGVPVE
ncbi:MAG: AraC family transcriptional regulator [Eubacteriales bacterium]|nr:AraC family transcriptional regulator [Eubacteriales bacterium]